MKKLWKVLMPRRCIKMFGKSNAIQIANHFQSKKTSMEFKIFYVVLCT